MNPLQIMQMVQSIQQNPVQFLQSRGFNIPQNINDPNSIIQYLMNTGQVTQDQYQNVRRMMQPYMK
jgi:hypothetical protein